jgi:short-subunit dehydrogenase
MPFPNYTGSPFRERVVAITGASAGIGRATALRFARAGAHVGLIARDSRALEEVKLEIESEGGRATVAPADVADAEAVFAAAARIEAEAGPIEAWVNDAMTTVFSPISEISPQEFRRVTEVTYLGFVHGTMAALKHMRPRNRGVIVQVGSALAYRGIPLQSAYCGAKHAIRGFTDSLRSELIHDKSRIKVTMVDLPAVNTPQFDWARTHMSREPRPVPPVVQPEAVAEAIHAAACRPYREYWLGLSTMKAILGNMVAPRCLDGMLARMGYESQERKSPVSPGRPDNLMQPVRGAHRIHGSFGREATSKLMVLTGEEVRAAVALGGLALLLSAVGGVLLGQKRSRQIPAKSIRRKVPSIRRRNWL